MRVLIRTESTLPLPAYQTEHAAGMDLAANLPEGPIELLPGARALLPTGLFIQLPIGTEAQVRPRSGLALKFGITVLNAPGTIDADYRGELKVVLINHGHAPFTINHGDRIAQLVLARYEIIQWHPTQDLEESARGTSGYGSTGH
jgi:dUTP pyrophosphatase